MAYPIPSVVIVGPTAVGKTELALGLAESMEGEIVSIDSRQVYRELNIGTAKPSARQRRRVRHHMIDLIEPGQTFSAGRFGAAARETVESLEARGRTALLVGGSGLYLTAAIDGLFDAPQPDPALRERVAVRLREQGTAALYDDLRRQDPAAASEIEPGDGVRILRALELTLTDGRQRAERWETDGGRGLRAMPMMICLTRPRDSLYRRIDRRTVEMFEAGWPLEVERLLEEGIDPGAPGLQSLGYAEILEYLAGRLPKDLAIEAIQRRTRRFSKRQMTWFRRDRRLRWLDLDRVGSRGARDRILRQWTASKPPPDDN